MFGIIQRARQLPPDWRWDGRTKVKPVGSTFTRASASATYFDSDLLLKTALTNVERYDHDPLTGACLGYLSERASTNNSTRSQNNFTHASFSNTALTMTDSAVVAPDGTTTASTMVETTANSTHQISRTEMSVTSGSIYGLSIFAKNISGSRWLQIGLNGGRYVNFNPSTGAIGSTSAGVTNTFARQLSNGWWRFSAYIDPGFTGTADYRIGPVASSSTVSSPTFVGDAGNSMAIWGMQLETAGVGVTSYMATAGSTATRALDVLTIPVASINFDAARGSVVVATYHLHTVPSAQDAHVINISDGTSNNYVNLNGGFSGGDGRWRAAVGSGAVSQFNFSHGTQPLPFVRRRAAIGWGTTAGQGAASGAMVTSATGPYALPLGLTTVEMGLRNSSSNVNGTIQGLAYYKGQRADAFVTAASRG